MRISIKKHNAQFLQKLAEQMGIDDLSEVINYLLLDIKGLGYSFGNTDLKQSQSIVKSVSNSLEQPIGFERFKPAFEPVSAVSASTPEVTDPVIQKFIDLGICDEF
jgi:hypothetical protein